ncbi:MAG: thioredoxin family protein [Dehalococcoidia bacterium]
MIRNKILLLLLCLIVTGLMFACGNPEESRLAKIPLEKALASGKPTIAEFGWRECIPCKDMRPILEELDEEYKNRLNVVIVEIPYHKDLAGKYGIRVMPVQIFFDAEGNEITRHLGFLPKEQIVWHLMQMGIQ